MSNLEKTDSASAPRPGNAGSIEAGFELVAIRLPVVATFAALVAGLGLGVALSAAALPALLDRGLPWAWSGVAAIGAGGLAVQ